MLEQAYPHDWDLEGAFPERRELKGFEGTGVYQAERDGLCFVIIDERRHAGGLDPSDPGDQKVLSRMVRVFEFADEAERAGWLKMQLGMW